MKPNRGALLRFRLGGLRKQFRKSWYKLLGLQIADGSEIGKITCEWPGKLTIGKGTMIHDYCHFWMKNPYDDNNYISIGDRSFVGRACVFNCDSRIKIGNDCLIANNVTLVDINHQIDLSATMNVQPCSAEEINIGDDVWIGAGSILLKGVTVGTGSVVAAGSVVNKSVPEYEIWAGVPARFIKKRE